MLISNYKIKNVASFLIFNLAVSYEAVKKFATSPEDLKISQGNDKSRNNLISIFTGCRTHLFLIIQPTITSPTQR